MSSPLEHTSHNVEYKDSQERPQDITNSVANTAPRSIHSIGDIADHEAETHSVSTGETVGVENEHPHRSGDQDASRSDPVDNKAKDCDPADGYKNDHEALEKSHNDVHGDPPATGGQTEGSSDFNSDGSGLSSAMSDETSRLRRRLQFEEENITLRSSLEDRHRYPPPPPFPSLHE